jgi:hypothetical protein
MKTLLAILILIQKAHGKRQFTRLISHVVIVAGLLLVTAIMISATLIGGLINAHIALLNSDVSPILALLITGTTASLIIALLIIGIVWRLRCLRNIPQALYSRLPFANRAMDALDSFTAGLMAE